VQTFIN
jgi:hypothetical protein